MNPVEPTLPLEPGEQLIRLGPHPLDEGKVEALAAIHTRLGFITEWEFTQEERDAIASGAHINIQTAGQHFHPISSWVQGIVPT